MYGKNDLENLFQNNFNLIMLLTVSDSFDFSKGIFYLIELCKVNVSDQSFRQEPRCATKKGHNALVAFSYRYTSVLVLEIALKPPQNLVNNALAKSRRHSCTKSLTSF